VATVAAAEAGCASRSPTQMPPPPAAPAPVGLTRATLSTAPESLRELLARNRGSDPEYAGGLSNHRSMALSALAWLGADDERLQQFSRARAARLEPLRPRGARLSGGWTSAIGVGSALVDSIDYFEKSLAAEGRDRVLRRALPELLPGLSGAAFHGMIRTAYALTAEDDAELAHALAYFTVSASPLRRLPERSASSTFTAQQLLLRVGSDPRFTSPRRFGLISTALRAAAEQPGFDETASALKVNEDTLDDLALGALGVYLGTRDFTALHCVTSAHALRLLLPYVTDPELALRYQFQAMLAAFISLAERRLQSPARPQPPDWSTLIARALASQDEHDIKLVFTCLDESRVRSPLAYREAAAARLGL